MQNLTTTTQNIALIPKPIIASSLFQLNLFTPYPLSDSQLEDYTNKILEIFPFISHQDILDAINLFASAKLPWNNFIAFQNLPIAIRKVIAPKIKANKAHLKSLKYIQFESPQFSLNELLEIKPLPYPNYPCY